MPFSYQKLSYAEHRQCFFVPILPARILQLERRLTPERRIPPSDVWKKEIAQKWSKVGKWGDQDITESKKERVVGVKPFFRLCIKSCPISLASNHGDLDKKDPSARENVCRRKWIFNPSFFCSVSSVKEIYCIFR